MIPAAYIIDESVSGVLSSGVWSILARNPEEKKGRSSAVGVILGGLFSFLALLAMTYYVVRSRQMQRLTFDEHERRQGDMIVRAAPNDPAVVRPTQGHVVGGAQEHSTFVVID